MNEIPDQRPAWLDEDEYAEQFSIQKVDAAEAGEQQKADEIFEALRVRFAKAWWDGYAAGVQDTQSEETTLNPWENP